MLSDFPIGVKVQRLGKFPAGVKVQRVGKFLAGVKVQWLGEFPVGVKVQNLGEFSVPLNCFYTKLFVTVYFYLLFHSFLRTTQNLHQHHY